MAKRKFATYDEVLLECLKKDPKMIEHYIEQSIEDFNDTGNLEELIYSLSMVTEAKEGVKKIAEKSHIDYKNLCKILANKHIPKADNFLKLLQAFNIKLHYSH
jgi:DNA-binding phage protein